ncbi:MAG: thioesterase family protein [Sphingomonadales bacterium]|nr:thioesterase family protein [Sphingomonadales bacterium]
MTFASVLASAQPRETGFALAVPTSWHQGRTAYGGFSAALCLAAATQAGDVLPPLRSATFSMIAPVAGDATVSAEIVRRGRNATWAEARIHSGGSLAFTASLVFMGPVASSLHRNDRPVPDDLVPLDSARAVTYTQYTPAFLREHIDSRHALTPSPEPRPEMCRWLRLNQRGGLDAMLELVLLGDALPPGVLPLMNPGVPVSTMHWQINLLTAAPQTRDGWYLLRSVGDYAEAGCSSQRMAIWNTDGQPIMAGLQSVALFG